MKMINPSDVAGLSKVFDAESPISFPMTTTRLRARKRNPLPLREAIPLWFALSSPLTGLVLGLLGAWFVTWLTN